MTVTELELLDTWEVDEEGEQKLKMTVWTRKIWSTWSPWSSVFTTCSLVLTLQQRTTFLLCVWGLCGC